MSRKTAVEWEKKDRDAKRIVFHLLGQHVDVTKAIAVRLDEADHAALVHQAAQLRVQPGTLARMLVHAGLTESLPRPGPRRGPP